MAIEGTSRIRALPASLRRHPALLVEWLRVVNSMSRWREEGSKAVVPLALSVLAVVVALLFAVWGRVVGGIETLADFWVLLAVVAIVYAATSVSGRRRQLEESKSQSWLVATPISPRSLLVSQAIRVLLPLCALAVMAVMVPALIALTHEGVAAAAEKVAGAAAGGLFVGGVVGWWTGRRVKSSGVVPSRYVPQPRARRSKASGASARVSGEIAQASVAPAQLTGEAARTTSDVAQTPTDSARASGKDADLCLLQPDAAALSGWPIAQVLAWSRPENSRYVLIAALLAVQGGSTAVAGLSVVAMYFVASYLAALLSAMTTVARSAATWLRATPITLIGFVWSVSRRALLHQLIGVALAVACMLLLGSPVGMALQVAALWLALFISISGFALVDNYRGRSPLVKIALSVATVAALAAVLQLRVGAKT